MRIKEMDKNNRPRERLFYEGAGALSDGELLSIILQYGFKGENVIDMSNKLIKEYGLEELNNLSVKEMTKIKGIGFAKACKVVAFEKNI